MNILFIIDKIFISRLLSYLFVFDNEECSMIDKETFHPLNYIKKEEYSGSMDGMRYMLKRVKSGEEDKIKVTIWPEPFGIHKTPDEEKESIEVALNEEGVDEAADWLNAKYEEKKEKWKGSLRKSWV